MLVPANAQLIANQNKDFFMIVITRKIVQNQASKTLNKIKRMYI